MTPVRPALLAAFAGLAGCNAAPPPEAALPRYVYYLHGKIVEDLGPRGISPVHGAYDYPGVLAALEREGLIPVGEIRPKDTDVSAYADKVVEQIRARISGGVPPSRIIVAGASKGAVIAALVSTRLREPKVRYVLLANCNDWLIRTHDPRLTGELLSIYEASDEIGGSCAPLAARSPDLQRFEEVRLDTGIGHGIVYRPIDEWVKPLADWAKR